MKRIATSLLTLLLLVGIVGCTPQVEVKNQDDPASEEKETATLTPESERQPIQIAKSGYWFDEYGYGHFGVILENANQGWAATNFTYTVSGKDAAGNIVGSDTQYVTLLFANGKNGYGGQTSFSGAQTLEFQVIDSKSMWEQETTQQVELDAEFHVQNIHASADQYGYTTVAGEVVNDTKGEVSNTDVSALFLAADGSVLGGCNGYVDALPAGSTVPFSIPYIEGVPEYAGVEAYLDFGNLVQ